jgi:hypothetical protein
LRILFLAWATAISPGCTCGNIDLGASNRAVAGQFQSLWGFPWWLDQKYVLSEKLDPNGEPTDLLNVLAIENLRSCEVQVRAPRWLWSLGSELMAFEAIDWNQWLGRLGRVALPCGPLEPIFENVYLAVWRDPQEAFFHVLANVDPATGKGRVVRFAWPSRKVVEVRRDVPTDYFSFDWPGERFFFREGGQIVSVRLDGSEEGRFGTGVTSYTSSGTGEIFFEQYPRLFRARTDGTELTALSEDACFPTFADARIVFLEPCSGPRRIVVLDRRTYEPLGRYGTSVSRFETGPEGWLSWTDVPPGQSEPRTLWIKPPGQDPVQVAAEVGPNWRIAASDGYLLYTAVTGEGRARLVSYDLGRGTSRVLGEGVDPALGIAQSPWSLHLAVVSGLHSIPLPDGGAAPHPVGTLKLTHPRVEEEYVVAATVPERGFQFSWQAPALGYLRDFEALSRSGSLEVFDMLNRKKIPVDVQVREFAEVYAPKRGVVYIVRVPERAGIYFVEASVSMF